jgi:hypothetical protein
MSAWICVRTTHACSNACAHCYVGLTRLHVYHASVCMIASHDRWCALHLLWGEMISPVSPGVFENNIYIRTCYVTCTLGEMHVHMLLHIYLMFIYVHHMYAMVCTVITCLLTLGTILVCCGMCVHARAARMSCGMYCNMCGHMCAWQHTCTMVCTATCVLMLVWHFYT